VYVLLCVACGVYDTEHTDSFDQRVSRVARREIERALSNPIGPPEEFKFY
jgi:hypothetical protein